MERQPLESTSLRSVGYDAVTQTLEIEFQSGGVYQYFGVPPDIYAGLLAAASHGQYFHEHIKDTYRRYRKVK